MIKVSASLLVTSEECGEAPGNGSNECESPMIEMIALRRCLCAAKIDHARTAIAKVRRRIRTSTADVDDYRWLFGFAKCAAIIRRRRAINHRRIVDNRSVVNDRA